MSVGSNTDIFIFSEVWNKNVNNTFATTKGVVQYYDPDNNILDINNLANTSNYELEFSNFKVGETLYFANTYAVFANLTNILYLARPPRPVAITQEQAVDIINSMCCGSENIDADDVLNSTNPTFNNCWGFQPGDCVEQRVPELYETYQLTDEAVALLCNACGCGVNCSCSEEEIESIRNVSVKVRNSYYVQATVVREDCANNALYITGATGEFVRDVPVCKCGPVNPCADIVGVFADPQPRSVIEGDYLVERYQWQPAGPFIGIDKSLGLDYTDKYLIICKPEIKGYQPMCAEAGDNGNGNRW